jgi:hypothetical protein
VVALLLQASPGLSADSQQGALDGSAIDLGPAGPDPTYGYGRLDAYAAYQRMGTSPDISVTLSPGSATVTPGGAATYTVSVTPLNGFTSDVALSLTGLTSSQAAWSFSPAVIPGGSGTATLTVSTSGSISPSTYPLSVAGSSGTTSRSATGSLTVSPPPDFGLALTPAAQTVTAGGTASSTARITALNGFGGTAVLSVSGLPANVGSTTVSPTQVAGGGTAQVTATTSPTAPAGSYPITVTANAGGMTHTATFTVTVAPPDWTIAVSPSSISISRRQTASYTVTLTAAAGAPGPVTLSVTGLPSGATGSLSRNPFAPPGSATLTVRTTSTTARGTFNLRVTGSDGARSHAVVVTLTVR